MEKIKSVIANTMGSFKEMSSRSFEDLKDGCYMQFLENKKDYEVPTLGIGLR